MAWVSLCLPLEWVLLFQLLLSTEPTLWWLLFIIYQWVTKWKIEVTICFFAFEDDFKKKNNSVTAEMKYLVISEHWCDQSDLVSAFLEIDYFQDSRNSSG